MTAPPRQLSFSEVLQMVAQFDLTKIQSVLGSLHLSIDGLGASYAKKPDKERAYLANRFSKAARRGSVHQRLLALTVWQKITGAYGPIPILAKILQQEALETNAAIHALNGLIGIAFEGAGFTSWQRAKLDRHCRRVYASILSEARDEFCESSARLQSMSIKDKHIALCTTQFLGRRHAPTGQILSLTKTLSNLGYRVKIFNQSLIPRRSASGFYFPFVASKLDKLNAIDVLDLGDGQRAGFWQNPHDEVTSEAFEGFLDVVADFGPSAMISLGPCNLYADLIGHHIPNASMPTTIDLAIGASGAYGTVQPLAPLQEALFKPLGITPDQVISIPPSFSQPVTQGPIDRAEFEVAPDEYAVAIVSNRASSEITEPFWQSLTHVLEQCPHMKLRIFGGKLGLASWQKTQFTKHPQVKFMGLAADLFGALAGFDAVLNPPRIGGGTSAAYAMAHGLNLFTLGDCDVATVGGDTFVYPSLGDMLEALKTTACAPERKSSIAVQAKARWADISDQKVVVEALLEGARKVSL